MRVLILISALSLSGCSHNSKPVVPPPIIEVPPPVVVPEPVPTPVPELTPVPQPEPPASTCEGVPKPPPVIETQFYEDGTSADFIYDGELRAIGEGPQSEELVMLPITSGIPPSCWAWQWRPVQ